MPSPSNRPHEIRRRQLVGSARSKSGWRGVGEETIIEVSLATTIGAILLLLAIGASLSLSYIVTYHPGCVTSATAMGGNPIDSALPQTRVTAASGGGTTTVVTRPDPSASVVVSPQEDAAMPPTCTAEQVAAVKAQLPPAGCNDGHPWRQKCSWTQATTGCQDHYWMTESYAAGTSVGGGKDAPRQPFVAIFVGWAQFGVKNGFFMQALQLGSRDPDKYNVLSFEKSAGGAGSACLKKPIEYGGGGSSTRQAGTRVYVLEYDEARLPELNRLKTEFLAGDELVIEHLPTVALDKWVDANLPGDGPIHQLSISYEGQDFNILMGASQALKRVRYLDFEVNWKSGWAESSFSTLIRRLKTRGFVCYFTGVSGELWRITDCWMNHFGQKHWGQLACVNAHHPDVREMLDRMEGIFLETLTRQISYG